MGVARPYSVENQYSHTSVYKLVQVHKSRTGKPAELVIGNRLHEQRQVSKIPTNHTWYLCLAFQEMNYPTLKNQKNSISKSVKTKANSNSDYSTTFDLYGL